MKSLFVSCFFLCLFPNCWSSNDLYGKYRDIFGQPNSIEPFHIDKITSQLFNQMECSKYSGINCQTVNSFNYLNIISFKII